MKTPQYAELRCRTNYSFLEGASHPEELIKTAHALDYKALAITDRHGVFALPKAYKEAKKHGFQLISGSELVFENAPTLTVLACTREGYGLMCRLLTASHKGQPKGQALISWSTFLDLVQQWPGLSDLIVIPRLWQEKGIHLQRAPEPQDYFETMKDLFGNRFYLPISRFLDGHDLRRQAWIQSIRKRYDIDWVATNDVHYHLSSRKILQDVLTVTRHGTTLKQAGTTLFSNAERYLKSPEQMCTLFADIPDAVLNTLKVAEQCQFSLSELRYHYPTEWIPAGATAQGFLEDLVWAGAKERYNNDIPSAVIHQINHELKLIAELSFADYFLTIWDIVAFAKRRGILCQGRGSAANSVVCFCLGITAIDPVRMNLLFERFISVERGEPPDIDVDFEHERREEVLQYVYQKYGRDRAAMVAAVSTYRSRGAHRDVQKAFDGVSLESSAPLQEHLEQVLQGFPRHLSIHSCGFTLSAKPLVEIVPVEPARMEGRTIIQWDKYDLDILGLLKVDLLALGMLTAIHKCFNLINGTALNDFEKSLSLSRVPAEDAATYDMICRADTIGVFQIESRAQMNMLPRLLPRCYYDLVVEVALVRPGPIHGDMVHPYLRRRQGLEPVDLPDPRLEPILGRTLGIPLFQEQIMKIAMVLGGFTPGEADELRRAIGAWRASGAIDEMSAKLRNNLLVCGLPTPFVEMTFQRMKGFSEYGFPESHAASFALLAYVSSYLKCHYPAAFTCALLNSQPLGFYSPHSLLEDAKRHGVQLLPIDPNHSQWDCTLESASKLRLGWRMVHGISKSKMESLIEQRRHRAFTSLADFLSRSQLSQSILHILAMGDAFQCFGYTQRQALWEILGWCLINQEKPSSYQLQLFQQSQMGSPSFSLPVLTDFEAIAHDYQAYGASVRGHPMAALRRAWGRRFPAGTAQALKTLSHGSQATAAGLVIARQRPQTAKGTVFCTLEDETGGVDLILHKQVYERYRDLVGSQPFLAARGIIQRDRNAVSLLVRSLKVLNTPHSVRTMSHDWH